MLIKILLEFTRFYKLQNVVKIDAISIQTRRGLISGGVIPGCICLFIAGPLPTPAPPGLQRSTSNWGSLQECECVCWGRGGGKGGGLQAEVYGI